MKNKLSFLLVLLMTSLCFVSCSDDDPKLGDWDLPVWNTEVNMSTIVDGTYLMDNPPLEKDLVFKCKNYKSLIFFSISMDGKELANVQSEPYISDWGTVSIKDNVLNVKLNPQAKELSKKIIVHVSVGDTGSDFIFNW